MITLPEMKETTIEIEDGVVIITQKGASYHTEIIKIPVSAWFYFTGTVEDQIEATQLVPQAIPAEEVTE